MRLYTLFFLAVLAVVLALTPHSPNTNDELDERGDWVKIGVKVDDPLILTGPDGIIKHSLSPRFDLPGGASVDIDGIAKQVYGKVQGEVGQAVDTAKSGLNDAVDAAKKGVNDAIDEAKKVLQDIENGVEDVWKKIQDIWQQIQDKVKELEDKVMTAIHDWVWKHIIHPLIVLLVLILLPFAILFLWWFLHLVARPFVREREITIEMQDRGPRGGERGDEGELPPRITRGGRGWAYWVVRSWESYGQGVICFACPWYGNWVLWRSRNKMRKDTEKLKDEMSILRQQMDWVLKGGFSKRDGGHTKP